MRNETISNKNLCTKEFIDIIVPDVIFFYGWSWIVPSSIIHNYMCLCLHPSKLPKYRGGSPIQNQIISGETDSAVSLFKMLVGVDDGPIYYQKSFSLEGYLNAILNSIKLAGCEGTTKFITDYKDDNIVFVEQNNDEATFCSRRSPRSSEVSPEDFLNNDSKYFFNLVRSLQLPYPDCYIKCKSGRVIFKEVGYE